MVDTGSHKCDFTHTHTHTHTRARAHVVSLCGVRSAILVRPTKFSHVLLIFMSRTLNSRPTIQLTSLLAHKVWRIYQASSPLPALSCGKDWDIQVNGVGTTRRFVIIHMTLLVGLGSFSHRDSYHWLVCTARPLSPALLPSTAQPSPRQLANDS